MENSHHVDVVEWAASNFAQEIQSEGSLIGVIRRDLIGRISELNDLARGVLGTGGQDVDSGSVERWDIVDGDGRLLLATKRPSALVRETGEPLLGFLVGTENGTSARRWLLTDTFLTRDDDARVDGTVTYFVDVTDSVNSRRQLAITSAITHIMLAGWDEATSLQRVCEALVEDGRLALAWVGVESPDDPLNLEVIHAAGEVDYLYPGIVSLDASKPSGRGPVGIAMRARSVQVANDLTHQSDFEPWRERAASFSLGSLLAIPLELAGRPAVLAMHDHARFVFDEEMVSRFVEVVREIEFGLAHVVSVNETRETLRALTETEQRFRIAFEGNMAPMLVTGPDDEPIAVNPAFCRLLGRSAGEILEPHWPPFTHPDDRQAADEAHRRLKSNQADQVLSVKRYVHRDGHTIVAEVSQQAARDEDGAMVYSVLSARDITEERALTDRLSHLAFHDPLTGLANRALFNDRLAHAIARVTRSHGLGAVLLLDLDDFKGINDTHGHLMGDDVLVGVARRLEQVTRSSDTLSRFGGDEFFYLAEGLSGPGEAEEIAARLLGALKEPFEFDGLSFRQSASVGIVHFDDGETTPAECVQRADLALYEAKSRGKARASTYNNALHEVAATRFELTQELHQASRAGDLVMHYQPIVDVNSLRTVGFEALMRWPHPVRGQISPNVFIPLAEASGLIEDLGALALRQALEAATSWTAPTGEAAPFVTVNLSASQFADRELAQRVEDALDDSGLSPSRLVVEITESVMFNDPHEALANLERLRGIGVRVALDDFGTGYSSIAHVVRLKPEIIKIDRFFVSPWFESEHHQTLLEAVVSLGERLGLSVIGEGVETYEQLEQLRNAGCDLAQGFLFSPAVSSHAAGELAAQGPWVLAVDALRRPAGSGAQ